MTDAGAAVGMDRLPWLDDEPAPQAAPRPRELVTRPRAKSDARSLAGWAVAAVLLVAGSSFWLGTQSGQQSERDRYEAPAAASPEAKVKLPEARASPATPTVPVIASPEVQPAPAPQVDVPQPRTERVARGSRPTVVRRRTLKPMDMEDSDLSRTVAEQEGAAPKAASAQSETAKAPAPAPAATVPAARPLASRQQLKLWPARETKGASGRLVQIGAFGTRQQAKLGWRRMQRAYPAIGRLPATVVTARNSRGKRFYRFQIGTTSQAHSEVLCQRMDRIRFSCAVVGLPWKAKVER